MTNMNDMTDMPENTRTPTENREKAPAVEIRDILFRDMTISETEVTVNVAVKNPMPVAVSLKKIEFSLNRVAEDDDGVIRDKYLGKGMRENVRLAPSSETVIGIDVLLRNTSLLSAAAEFLTGSVTVKVAGTVSFDLKIFAPAIRFEETKIVNGLPSILSKKLEDF